ncbi:AraC family transcriptional regulator [Roseibium denhamense]|nr:AraC family transcriptional regulator [Roseibium denhamense]
MQVPYRTSFNGKLDRLSSLIDRLRVQVSQSALSDPDCETALLWVCETPAKTQRLILCPTDNEDDRAFTGLAPRPDERVKVSARIAISGVGKQLISALPDCLSVELSDDPYLQAVVTPLIEEVVMPRCGGQAVFQRLCEVVVIRLLRHAMAEGKVNTGLLNGLAHPRIAEALVGIHEAPAEAWSLEKLAQTAGMSRTQFAVTFKDLVGVTPMGYLASWRLEIAREELESGRQVKSVANLCGFSSPAAFSRAYSKRFGVPPRGARAAS